jgi:di/tricarboxylate transporter
MCFDAQQYVVESANPVLTHNNNVGETCQPYAEAWSLLAIFMSTVTGLVIKPAPVGAWAFMALTFTVTTRTLTFQQGLGALTNEVIWLIVVATFFARAFIKTVGLYTLKSVDQ